MSVNAREEQFEHIELFGKPALFTNSRIDRATVPDGFHCYDLRDSDNDPGKPITVEKLVGVNHVGTVLTITPVKPQKDKDFRRISGKLNFLGEELDLLTLQPDNRTFTLCPASHDEAGLFYSSEQNDTEFATVGHLRIVCWMPHIMPQKRLSLLDLRSTNIQGVMNIIWCATTSIFFLR